MDALAEARETMRLLTLTPNEAQKHGITIRLDGVRRDALSLLSLPNVDFQTISAIWLELGAISAQIREQLEIDAQYAGYLDRQDADILAFRRDEERTLPADIDYAAVIGLSNEIRQKLSRIRPATLGQAARIDGMTPAALTLVLAHVRAGSRRVA
jgi:tRNA uridine 5-carboxymethylaminomethyl modification enzyme